MSDMEPLLDELAAARFLAVSAGTLRNWRSKNRGPEFIHIGASVRYSPERLRRYVEARTRRVRDLPHG